MPKFLGQIVPCVEATLDYNADQWCKPDEGVTIRVWLALEEEDIVRCERACRLGWWMDAQFEGGASWESVVYQLRDMDDVNAVQVTFNFSYGDHFRVGCMAYLVPFDDR